MVINTKSLSIVLLRVRVIVVISSWQRLLAPRGPVIHYVTVSRCSVIIITLRDPAIVQCPARASDGNYCITR